MLFHIVHEFSPTVCVCARYDSVSVLCVWCVKIADVGQGKCFYICVRDFGTIRRFSRTFRQDIYLLDW